MKTSELTIPEIGLIAATRGMLGAGLGLLLGGRLSEDQRRAAGLALLLVGAITTIPLVLEVIGKSKACEEESIRAEERFIRSEKPKREEPLDATQLQAA